MFGYNIDTDNNIIAQRRLDKQVSHTQNLKVKNMYYAAALDRIGEHKAARRVADCSTELAFATLGNKTRLYHANFCRDRLCPICVFNSSKKVYRELSCAMDKLQSDSSIQYIFLTLTVRNCHGNNLPQTLDAIFDGWNRFTSNKRYKDIFVGWFRALEITYNARKDTYHPHLHIVLAVSDDYFGGQNYIASDEWCYIWQRCAKLDYKPICDIRRVRPKLKDLQKIGAEEDLDDAIRKTLAAKAAAKEAAKYVSKSTDYLAPEIYGAGNDSADEQLIVLRSGLKNRRVYAYGGALKEAAKAAAAEWQKETKEMRDDIEAVITEYRWFVGAHRYEVVDENIRTINTY